MSAKRCATRVLAPRARTNQWYPVDGLSDPNIADPVATPFEDQIYAVVGTDDNGCCTGDDDDDDDEDDGGRGAWKDSDRFKSSLSADSYNDC